MKTLILVMTMSLISTPGLSLDTSFYPSPSQKHDVAEKLKEGEICKRDLKDTTDTLYKCSSEASVVGDEKLIFGAAIGAVLTLVVCGIIHGGCVGR